MQRVLIIWLLGMVMLSSCKKENPPTHDKEDDSLTTGHVLGYRYSIDSTFIGTWQLKGSYIGEFMDVSPFGWLYRSESYQNKYIDFQPNGLAVFYRLDSTGAKQENDTLIYSNRAPAVSPPTLQYYNYQPAVDSSGNTIYEFAYPLMGSYHVTKIGNKMLLDLYDVINTSQVDTLEFVAL